MSDSPTHTRTQTIALFHSRLFFVHSTINSLLFAHFGAAYFTNSKTASNDRARAHWEEEWVNEWTSEWISHTQWTLSACDKLNRRHFAVYIRPKWIDLRQRTLLISYVFSHATHALIHSRSLTCRSMEAISLRESTTIACEFHVEARAWSCNGAENHWPRISFDEKNAREFRCAKYDSKRWFWRCLRLFFFGDNDRQLVQHAAHGIRIARLVHLILWLRTRAHATVLFVVALQVSKCVVAMVCDTIRARNRNGPKRAVAVIARTQSRCDVCISQTSTKNLNKNK